MPTNLLRAGTAFLAAAFILSAIPSLPARASVQTSPVNSPGVGQTRSTNDTDSGAARRAARRRARARSAAQAAHNSATPANTTVAPSAAQRARDAHILAQQKAQSARTAQENDQTVSNVVREQQQQQAEPRIQDAPGPGSQPLPGDPAIAPAQPSAPPRIQDAPGPAQTLPQPPPPTTAPAAPPTPQN